MFPVPQLLSLLIIAAPAAIIFDGPLVYGLVLAVAAVALVIVAVRIQPGEADFFSSVVHLPTIFACAPAFWMLIQVLPLKAIGLANPIWDSASAALGRPLIGSISIDPGATLICLARYLSAAAIAMGAAAVAVNRYRSKWILFPLVASTTLIAAMILARRSGYLTFPDNGAEAVTRDAASDCAALGVILAAAAARVTFENGQTTNQDGSAVRLLLALATGFAAGAVCLGAVILDATHQTYFALGCGVATFIFAVAVRRFRVGPWGYSAIAATAFVVVVAVVALQPAKQPVDLTLMFSSRASAPLVGITERILAETRWTGTGAGTFAEMLPIFRDIDELTVGSIPPTAAAALAVEMGRPFLWAMLALASALVISLLGAAARRGRDSSYPMAGASSVVTFTLLAFGNPGLFSTPLLIISAATIGMAIAQSKSRSV